MGISTSVSFAIFLLFMTTDAYGGDTYTFDELKSHLDIFEDTLTQKFQHDMNALEKRMKGRQDIEMRRLKRGLTQRVLNRVPLLLEERVTDLVKSGSIKTFINNALLNQVNSLHNGLRLVKANLRALGEELSLVKARENAIESKFLTCLKERENLSEGNVTSLIHDIKSELHVVSKNVNKNTMETVSVKDEVSAIRSRLEQTSENLSSLSLKFQSVKTEVTSLKESTVRKMEALGVSETRALDLCPTLRTPNNGAMVCSSRAGGAVCQLQCPVNYDVPKASGFVGLVYLCQNISGTLRWNRVQVPDCYDGKPSAFTAISPAKMGTFSLKVIKSLSETLPDVCLERCKEEAGCDRAIHCVYKPCQVWKSCSGNKVGLGICYLMGTKGTQLQAKSFCKISKPGPLKVVLKEQKFNKEIEVTDEALIIELPTELQDNDHESENPKQSEKEIPASCLEKPSYRNQGAVLKQRSRKPGYPVVLEYDCGKQGEWTYKYVTGTTEATCDEDGKWTLPALLCIPTNCYYQQKNGRNMLKAWYSGNATKTENGLVCQKWISDTPQRHSLEHKKRTMFPSDFGVEDVGNKCRDLDGDGKPWCYTTSPSTRWAFCSVPMCSDVSKCGILPYQPGTRPIRTEIEEDSIHVTYSCLDGLEYDGGDVKATCNIATGIWTWPKLLCYSRDCYYYDGEMRGKAIYKGGISSTNSGKKCQRFDSQSPHNHSGNDKVSDFPGETSLEDLGNQCRDGDGESAPWCYTMDPDKRWEFCDIPECILDLKLHRVVPKV